MGLLANKRETAMLPTREPAVYRLKIPLESGPDLVLTRETRIINWEIDMEQQKILVSIEEVLIPKIDLSALLAADKEKAQGLPQA